MQKHINCFITDYLSEFLCGYRQGFSTQHTCLNQIDRKLETKFRGYSGVVLMDLSKAFDTINFDRNF